MPGRKRSVLVHVCQKQGSAVTRRRLVVDYFYCALNFTYGSVIVGHHITRPQQLGNKGFSSVVFPFCVVEFPLEGYILIRALI
jgi:hypothetical protein